MKKCFNFKQWVENLAPFGGRRKMKLPINIKQLPCGCQADTALGLWVLDSFGTFYCAMKNGQAGTINLSHKIYPIEAKKYIAQVGATPTGKKFAIWLTICNE